MHSLSELIGRIDSPNRERCLSLMADNLDRFLIAPGSSHNHQAWPGGYIDHIEAVMSTALVIYEAMSKLRELPFTLESALLVLFLHDLEKPWKAEREFQSKLERAVFRAMKIDEYEITMTQEQIAALMYVEGEGDVYRSDRRVMNELGAFCHMCDVASARIWHDKEPANP